MFNLLLHTYSLVEKAKQSKKFYSIATNRAKVTNNVQHFVAGLKCDDISAKFPLTGKQISPQTRNICRPLKFVMGSKNKAMHKNHINPLYRWWEEATEDDGNGQSKIFPDTKTIELSSTGDMSATWKILRKGGTAKIKTFFVTVVTVP